MTIEQVLERAGLQPEDRAQWTEAARAVGWDERELRQALREAEALAHPERKRQRAKAR